ncbi:MAG: nitronate monooxygenase [Clostridium sp.]
MKIEGLRIGELFSRLPIVQGGMGVGVSAHKLATAVTNAGGIGIISSAQIGYMEPDFEYNTLEANLRALKENVRKAKEATKGGIIGVNIMVAMINYKEAVKATVESGADIIISGAGLPLELPKLTKGFKTKIAPIVSSLKSARVILKYWDRHDKVTADMVVIEGPRAGGHLGFKVDDIESATINFDEEVVKIIEEVKVYEEKYSKKIPVIVGGGVFTGEDIAKYLKLGANGVQMATRFVGTVECDASMEFKEAYINSKDKDIDIVKSPVGMPGRAITNEFVMRTREGRIPVEKCYRCISHCNPAETPYCITKALINSVKGNLKEGLIFCGDNASRIKEIVPVAELMKELEEGIAES